MVKALNVSWSQTKKNVQNVITKYIYYTLSVDYNPASKIDEEFLLKKFEFDYQETYLKLEEE